MKDVTALDATARLMRLAETHGMMRVLAAASIAHGTDTYEGAACYRCTMDGQPVVVVGDCEYWDVMANTHPEIV